MLDAVATYNSTPLNKSLLEGPNLLNYLVGILTRFCMGRYTVMGNIDQMFLQILVKNKDRDVLRFLWMDKCIDPIEDYCMSVHLFMSILHA